MEIIMKQYLTSLVSKRKKQKSLNSFELTIGPETENEQILQYDRFLKTIDSTRAAEITFEDFIDNRSIYAGSIFQIAVESTKNDIFRDLEEGLNSSFSNKYSEEKMRKRDSLISLQKQNILEAIEEVERLQQFYINVLEEESKSSETKYSLGETLSLTPEGAETKEYELLNEEIRLRSELRKLDERKIQEDVFFDIISSFQQIGSKSDNIFSRFSLIFPILAFVLICLMYCLLKLANFVKNYE